MDPSNSANLIDRLRLQMSKARPECKSSFLPSSSSNSHRSLHHRTKTDFSVKPDILPKDISHLQDPRTKSRTESQTNISALKEILGVPKQCKKLPQSIPELEEMALQDPFTINTRKQYSDMKDLQKLLKSEKYLKQVAVEGGFLYRTHSGLILPQLSGIYEHLTRQGKSFNSEVPRLELDLGNPSGRKEVKVLITWLESMMDTFVSEPALSVKEKVRRAALINTVCFREVIRQVSNHCLERGALLHRIWNAQIDIYNTKDKEKEKKIEGIEKKCREVLKEKENKWEIREKGLESEVKELKSALQNKEKNIFMLKTKIDEMKLQFLSDREKILAGVSSEAGQSAKWPGTGHLVNKIYLKAQLPVVMCGYYDVFGMFHKTKVVQMINGEKINEDNMDQVVPFVETSDKTTWSERIGSDLEQAVQTEWVLRVEAQTKVECFKKLEKKPQPAYQRGHKSEAMTRNQFLSLTEKTDPKKIRKSLNYAKYLMETTNFAGMVNMKGQRAKKTSKSLNVSGYLAEGLRDVISKQKEFSKLVGEKLESDVGKKLKDKIGEVGKRKDEWRGSKDDVRNKKEEVRSSRKNSGVKEGEIKQWNEKDSSKKKEESKNKRKNSQANEIETGKFGGKEKSFRGSVRTTNSPSKLLSDSDNDNSRRKSAGSIISESNNEDSPSKKQELTSTQRPSPMHLDNFPNSSKPLDKLSSDSSPLLDSPLQLKPNTKPAKYRIVHSPAESLSSSSSGNLSVYSFSSKSSKSSVSARSSSFSSSSYDSKTSKNRKNDKKHKSKIKKQYFYGKKSERFPGYKGNSSENGVEKKNTGKKNDPEHLVVKKSAGKIDASKNVVEKNKNSEKINALENVVEKKKGTGKIDVSGNVEEKKKITEKKRTSEKFDSIFEKLEKFGQQELILKQVRTVQNTSDLTKVLKSFFGSDFKEMLQNSTIEKFTQTDEGILVSTLSQDYLTKRMKLKKKKLMSNKRYLSREKPVKDANQLNNSFALADNKVQTLESKPNAERSRSRKKGVTTEEFLLGVTIKKNFISHPAQKLFSSILANLNPSDNLKITLKSLLKIIPMVYQEKLALCKENTVYNKYETYMVLYDLLIKKYGLKNVAEGYFLQVIKSTAYFQEKYLRVKLFSKFLGTEPDSFKLEDWNFCISLLEIIDIHNYTKIFSENEGPEVLCSLNAASQVLTTFLSNKFSEKTLESLFSKINSMKIIPAQNLSRRVSMQKLPENINLDEFLLACLEPYIEIRTKIKENFWPGVDDDQLLTEEEFFFTVKPFKVDAETEIKLFEKYSIAQKVAEDKLQKGIKIRSVAHLIFENFLPDLKSLFKQ